MYVVTLRYYKAAGTGATIRIGVLGASTPESTSMVTATAAVFAISTGPRSICITVPLLSDWNMPPRTGLGFGPLGMNQNSYAFPAGACGKLEAISSIPIDGFTKSLPFGLGFSSP